MFLAARLHPVGGKKSPPPNPLQRDCPPPNPLQRGTPSLRGGTTKQSHPSEPVLTARVVKRVLPLTPSKGGHRHCEEVQRSSLISTETILTAREAKRVLPLTPSKGIVLPLTPSKGGHRHCEEVRRSSLISTETVLTTKEVKRVLPLTPPKGDIVTTRRHDEADSPILWGKDTVKLLNIISYPDQTIYMF